MISRLFVVALALSVLPFTAGADADAPADLADLGIGFDDFDLDDLDVADELALLAAEDVVVSAARRLQRIEESPSAITVITREQILASGYDNIGDLMRLVPGADVYRITQSHVAIGLRSRSTWAGDRMLVLVDGRDVAMHVWGLPQWMGMPFDVESIERIEVIRGPGSTLYGANALQGVVNIVTRASSDRARVAEATVALSGSETFSADARSHGGRGRWAYWVGAGYDRRARYALPTERDHESLRGRMRVDYAHPDGIDVRAEAGVVQMTGSVNTYIGDGRFSSFWPYVLGRVAMGRTEIMGFVDWTDMTLDIDLGLRLADDPDGPVFASAPRVTMPTRGAEITALHTFDPFEGNRLLVGATGRAIHHMPGGLVTCPDVEPANFDPGDCVTKDVLEFRLGLFVQNEWYLRDDLLLNLGARLDHNSLTAQPGISPRAALVHSYAPGQSVRATFGRAYRKPTLAETDLAILVDVNPDGSQEIGRRLQHLLSRVGNRDLVNESVDALELGWRSRFLDDRLSLAVELFGARFQRSIVAVTRNVGLVPGLGGVPQIPDDGELTFENRSLPIWGYGGEAIAQARPWPLLEIGASYAFDRTLAGYLNTETGETDYDVDNRWEPEHRIVATARLRREGFSAGFDAIWMSHYTTETRHPYSALGPATVRSVGASTLVNGQVAYRVPLDDGRSAEVGLAALNLLGQPYRDVGAFDVDGLALGGGEPIRPRARLFVRGSF